MLSQHAQVLHPKYGSRALRCSGPDGLRALHDG